MKVFLYYCYYRLYQWSQKREARLAEFWTVIYITLALFSHVAILFSLMGIFFKLDYISLLISDKSSYIAVAWLAGLGVLVGFFLRLFHMHEKAFSDEMKQKYEKMGCKGWWVVTYYFASYFLMAVTVWFAGAALGHH